MENKGYYLPQDVYSEHLKNINGVNFTRREIDIIAFLIRGRTAKKIAALLSIAPKTVENHTHNIMIKLQCNSRESIIDFIEKSGKFSFFKEYYKNLMVAMAFERSLKAVASLKAEKNLACIIIYWPNQVLTNAFVAQLEAHLKLLGALVSLEARENIQPLSNLIGEVGKGAYKIYVLPHRAMGMPSAQIHGEDFEAHRSLPTDASPFKNDLFLLPEDGGIELPKAWEVFHSIDSKEYENYYFFVFAILQKIFPDLNFDPILLEFKESCNALDALSDSLPSPSLLEEKQSENQKAEADIKAGVFSKDKGWLIASLLITFGLLAFGFLTFKTKNDHSSGILANNPPQSLKSQDSPPIRSDLIIPTASALLDRSTLFAQIEDKFKKQQAGIQIVALVGIGGAGKTTLARQYARTQKSSVVWEISAANKESLMSSIEDLAYALSQTEKEMKTLRRLQDIKNSKQREEKILLFLKDRLKSHPNWLLIYDNVEKVSTIQKFFPSDPNVWGTGKVIITTIDSNIKNIGCINSTIQVGELSSADKFNLFSKIINSGDIKTFSSNQKQQIMEFLDKIPPFPLDISVAAYYLKTTNISYTKYLEYLKGYNKDFADAQENVLKEGGEYAKTRYNIITLSLKKLIDAHKDFGDLLLLISLLDSQDIPRSLLDHYKSDVVVDNFIYHLRKYSLITDVLSSTTETLPGFSIHQSTQEICLIYLTKILSLNKNKKVFAEISYDLEKYITEIAEQQDFFHMRILINHCEKFLRHKEYLSDSIIAIINGELGCLYLGLGDDKKAIQLINKSIEFLTRYYHGNHPLLPRFLNYLGKAYFDLGDYKRAKVLYQQSLKIYQQYFPKDYRGIADTFSEKAIVVRALGDYKRAQYLLEQSLILYKKYFPDNHLRIAWILKHLGYSSKELGDYEKAKDLLEQGLALYQENYPEGNKKDELHTWIQVGLGNLYRELGNYRKAKELFEQSLLVYKKNLPENHHKIARVLKYLGMLYREWGDYEGAKEFLERSLHIYEKYYPEDYMNLDVVLKYLGTVYRRLGDYQKSKELLERSLKIQNNLLGFDNMNSDSIYLFLGNLYVDLGDYNQAKKMLTKCLEIYGNHYGKNHIAPARVLRYLGRAYFKEGDAKSAEEILLKSLSLFQPSNHPHTYRVLEDLGTLYQNLSLKEIRSGNKQGFENYQKQALDYMTQALQTAKKHFPEDSPHLKRIQGKQKSIENKELKDINLE